MKRFARLLLGLVFAAAIFAGLGFAAAMTAGAAHDSQPVARTSEFG